MALNKYSITDYLKSQGKDGSYTARKQLAEQYGISGYSGTADQNTNLLNQLQGQSGKPAYTPPATPPNRLQDAYSKLAEMEEKKPGEYSSQYSSQIEDILDSILNRDKFSYDMNADPLYQQYKDSYMRQGNLAMRDTMGNASALSGGYGNSYASTAGSQAYDSYVGKLNDRIPELYQLAYNMYRDEGNDLYNQLGAVQGLDNTDYGRYRDNRGDFYTDRDYYNGKANTIYGQDYQEKQDALSQQNWEKQFAYQQQQDAAQLALQKAKASSGSGSGSGTGSSKKGQKPLPNPNEGKLTVNEAATTLDKIRRKDGVDAAIEEANYMLKHGLLLEEKGDLTAEQRIARMVDQWKYMRDKK